ncbi:MAG: hypothetical protein ACK5L7_05110 [Paludibacteraceae bacterium]
MKKNILSVLFLYSAAMYAQNMYIGINLSAESNISDSNTLCYGVSIEKKLSNHFGFVSGFDWMNNYHTADNTKINNFSIPVNFKYYSKIVNVTLGPNLVFFTGWKDLAGKSDIINVEDNNLNINAVFKLSHSILLDSKLELEPQLIGRYAFQQANIGLGVGIKYHFY